MSDGYRVRLATIGDGPTAHGSAASGPGTVVVDRPVAAGGGGLGFNGGQLFYLAIAACWSNDLYREAATMGIVLDAVEVTVDGDFPARGAGSTPISVEVTVTSSAPEERVRDLIAEVERVAEIPRAIREGPPDRGPGDGPGRPRLRRWAGVALAVAGLFAACSPAPAPTETSTARLETPTATATAQPGVVVVVRAGGRAHCEWVVGCGVFLEFAPTTEAVSGDPPTWQPRGATDLRIGQAGEYGDSWVEVFDTEDRVPPVAPGTYRVVAGLYWADDTNTPRPEDPFPVVDVPFACASPLEVDEISERVTVALQLEPDGTCSLLASAEPVSGGVPVTFNATGELDCPSYYGCQAVLSVLTLPPGATPPPTWYEHARVEFETVFDDWRRLAGAPIDPPTSLGPSTYVIVAGTRFTSDLASQDPDGSVVFPEIGADTCDAPLVVEPGATSVAISVDFDVESATCAVEANVD